MKFFQKYGRFVRTDKTKKVSDLAHRGGFGVSGGRTTFVGESLVYSGVVAATD